MSQNSKARSSKNPNRIFLTAQSLMPGSAFMVCAISIAFVVSMVAFFVFKFPSLFSVFVIACGMGLGHMTAIYQRSERRRLVPGMNETCAAIAMASTVALWLANAAMIMSVYGWIPEAYGITLLLAAFSLWLGWGERRIYHVLFYLFLVLFVLIVVPDGPTRVYEVYIGLSMASRNLLAVAIGLAGCSAYWRFWTLTSSKIDPSAFKQQKDIFSFLSISQADREFSDSAKGSNASAVIPNSLSTRLQWMLYGRVYWNRLYILWGLFSAGFILIACISARGHIEGTAAFTIIAAIILIIMPTTMFLIRVPQTFRRLWMAGIADDRSKTARQILQHTAWRSFSFSGVLYALLLIQAPFTLDWLVTILFVLLVSLSVSGIGLWVAAKWYVFWSNKTIVVFLAYVFIAVSLLGLLTPFSMELVLELNRTLVSFGLANSLLGIGSITALIWFGCVYDSSISLGNAERLMECEADIQATIDFNTQPY